MLLLVHIVIALSSLVSTGYAYLRPSKKTLNISYGFVAGTLLTGSYLVISKPSHMVSTCVTGLVYLMVVFAGIFAARKRLAEETA